MPSCEQFDLYSLSGGTLNGDLRQIYSWLQAILSESQRSFQIHSELEIHYFAVDLVTNCCLLPANSELSASGGADLGVHPSLSV